MHSIPDILQRIKQGKMIIVVDDENRENEGDLMCAAQTITAEHVNFMTRYGRGLVCIALPEQQIEHLELPLMRSNTKKNDHFGTAFTYSIDAAQGISTGISAHDRALTIQLAVNPSTKPSQLVIPGHVFPLKAHAGGVLARRGHTEAAIDLTKQAGIIPGGVICEILNEDGTMMRLPQLKIFAKQHHLPIISIAQLVEYRITQEIKTVCQTTLQTKWGNFNQRIYHDLAGKEHVVLWLGLLTKKSPPLTRIHSECLTGDAFGSIRCDCGMQLQKSFELISKEKNGIIMYLRQEGRGIGLTEKIKAYALQEKGLDTIEANYALGHKADERSYETAIKMLYDLDITEIQLLTNNPHKIIYLQQHGIRIIHVPLIAPTNKYNERYQQSKAKKLGHLIPHKQPLVANYKEKKEGLTP